MSVYMIRAGTLGDVKIGTATNVVTRVKQLQTSMPHKLRIVRVFDGGKTEEATLHKRFADRRLAGEWFKPNDEMLTGDLGLTDLPVPSLTKRIQSDAPHSRRWALHADLLQVIGGVESLAKALGIAPWEAGRHSMVNRKVYSAAVLMARAAGCDNILVKHLTDLDDEIDAAFRNQNLERERAEEIYSRRQLQIDWITKNGASAAWWKFEFSTAPEPTPARAGEA